MRGSRTAWPNAGRRDIHSSNEAFLDLHGLETHLTPYLGSLDAYARKFRADVNRRTGIPTCVRIGPTKTLVKLANRIAKKDALA